MSNLSDKISGKADQYKGKATDDKPTEIKGNLKEKKADITDKLT